MKEKTTRAAIMRTYADVLAVPACGLQSLLSLETPAAYNAGVCGWNYDVYAIGNVAICTGYRSLPGRRAENVEKFENAARSILMNENDYTIAKTALRELAIEFTRQA